MNKFLVEIRTDMTLAQMFRLMGRIEKIINTQERVVKYISVKKVEEK